MCVCEQESQILHSALQIGEVTHSLVVRITIPAPDHRTSVLVESEIIVLRHVLFVKKNHRPKVPLTKNSISGIMLTLEAP